MSDEPRAAAERVRRWHSGEWLAGVYPDAKDRAQEIALLESDWRDVAVAYLAEHPADDGEPATEEWAKALGEWSQYTSSSGVRWYHGPADVYLRFDANGCEMGVGCVGETQYLLSDPTRGHVRRLCAVAGSPLKEPAKP